MFDGEAAVSSSRGEPNPRGPVVLMYHSVDPGRSSGGWPWAVPLKRFREHLRLIRDRGWRTVRFSDLLARDSAAERTVAITFDDGYTDNLAAFEEVVRHGMSATWFVVSGRLGGTADWLSGGNAGRQLFSAADLRTLADAGMEIGSHTRSHAKLTELPANALHGEIAGSKADLEDLLGIPVTSFAYPFGRYDERSVDAVGEAGYRIACTTRSGWALRSGDPLRVNRLTVWPGDTPRALRRKIMLGSNDGSRRGAVRYLAQRSLSHLRGTG